MIRHPEAGRQNLVTPFEPPVARGSSLSEPALGEWILPIGLAIVLVCILWAPALFGGRIIAQADAVMLGVPLMDLGARALQGAADLQWSPVIYGGHPVFAEGQGGYADPLILLFARWVTPAVGAARAATLIHCLFLVLGAVGMTGLCRSFGIRRWGCCLAVAAVIFSPDWVRDQHNLPVSASAMWVPWLIWAAEVWLVRPAFGSAAFLGTIAALMLLGGYPQTLHSTLLYILVRALMIIAGRSGRETLLATWRLRLATGAFSVLVAGGLAAVQLFPLIELIGQSHRDGGTRLIFQSKAPLFINGLLYDVIDSTKLPKNVPGVGSIFVIILSIFSAIRFRENKIIAHIAATAVLVNFSMGTGSAIFRLFYDWHLLFGLHYFRMTFINMNPTVVGFGLLAAVGAQEVGRLLARAGPATVKDLLTPRSIAFAGLAIAALCALVIRFHVCQQPYVQFGVLLAALVGAVALFAAGRPRLVGPLLAGLIVVEVLGLRAKPYAFFDPAIVSEPETIQAIQQRLDWRDFKIFDATHTMWFAFFDPRTPDVGAGMRRALTAGAALTPLLWNLRAFTGHLALPLKRRMMLEPEFYAEVGGRPSAPIGARPIDLLSVGYVSLEAPSTVPGFELLSKADNGIWLYRNTGARPRFQFFDHAVAVASPEAALATLEHLQSPALVVEAADGTLPPGSLAGSPEPAAPPPELTVIDERASAYHLQVTASAPTWLFLADANYPGWTASIDGAATRIYTGQLLGKAIWLPAGAHEVGLHFKSKPFIWGRAVSVATLILLLAFGTIWSWRRRNGIAV